MKIPLAATVRGQFDKYLWPYLKKDLENGSCTLEEAEEALLRNCSSGWMSASAPTTFGMR